MLALECDNICEIPAVTSNFKDLYTYTFTFIHQGKNNGIYCGAIRTVFSCFAAKIFSPPGFIYIHYLCK